MARVFSRDNLPEVGARVCGIDVDGVPFEGVVTGFVYADGPHEFDGDDPSENSLVVVWVHGYLLGLAREDYRDPDDFSVQLGQHAGASRGGLWSAASEPETGRDMFAPFGPQEQRLALEVAAMYVEPTVFVWFPRRALYFEIVLGTLGHVLGAEDVRETLPEMPDGEAAVVGGPAA